jgi:hypothetical protein
MEMLTLARVRQVLTRKLPRWVLPTLLLLLFWRFPVDLLKHFTFSKEKLAHSNPTSYVFHVPVEQLRNQLPWLRDRCPAPPTPCLVLYRPSNGTDYFADQLERTPSDVYHLWGKPLPYKAEYTLRVTPLSESKTLVNVSTTKADVLLGSNLINGDDAEWVDPTTIEEYRILQLIGDRVGEQNMPPLELPK